MTHLLFKTSSLAIFVATAMVGSLGACSASSHDESKSTSAPDGQAAADAVTSAGLVAQSRNNPDQLAKSYKGRARIIVFGRVRSIEPYAYFDGNGNGNYSNAVILEGGLNSPMGVQLTPLNNDATPVAGVKIGETLKAQCSSLTQLYPGAPVLSGCTLSHG